MFNLFNNVFHKFLTEHDLVVINAMMHVLGLQGDMHGSLFMMDDLEMSNAMHGVNSANSDANFQTPRMQLMQDQGI